MREEKTVNATDGKYVYFVGLPRKKKVVKIDVVTKRITDTLELDRDCYCLEEDGTYLYAGSAGKLIKIALTTFSIVDEMRLEDACKSLHNTKDGYMTIRFRLSPEVRVDLATFERENEEND